jgi:hypothetical protein
MKTIIADFAKWHIECLPDDGARISVLRYDGRDLLTANPPSFKAPEKFYGEYETRPVYGYDDCFPTVDPCKSPDQLTNYRDHGELCWLQWQVIVDGNSLLCSIGCYNPKVTFNRILEFSDNTLCWKYEVINTSAQKYQFLHVMHPLMPLNQIQSIGLPRFSRCVDDVNSVDLSLYTPQLMEDHLLTIVPSRFEMLLLSNINAGLIKLGFEENLFLEVSFDKNIFPTLGIWWNNAGYPAENGMNRTECAFEPIPGTCSNLSDSVKDGVCLIVESGETIRWEINWKIYHQ